MLTGTNPFVRYTAKSTYFIDSTVVARDCRILYIISGEGNFLTPNKSYPLAPGALVYYPCGVPYHITSKGVMLFYTVNFDFTDKAQGSDRSVTSPMAYKGKVCSGLFDEGIPEEFKQVIYIGRGEFAESALKEIYGETVKSDPHAEAARSAQMKLLLINICRNTEVNAGETTLCVRIKKCVEQNPCNNNTEIAKKLSYHPYYLNAVFKKNEGISLHKYIMKKRLARAKELITTTPLSFDTIAEECGFSSASHLCRYIGKEYGITPSGMRRL